MQWLLYAACHHHLLNGPRCQSLLAAHEAAVVAGSLSVVGFYVGDGFLLWLSYIIALAITGTCNLVSIIVVIIFVNSLARLAVGL